MSLGKPLRQELMAFEHQHEGDHPEDKQNAPKDEEEKEGVAKKALPPKTRDNGGEAEEGEGKPAHYH